VAEDNVIQIWQVAESIYTDYAPDEEDDNEDNQPNDNNDEVCSVSFD
jgi:hypothetical protein